MTYLYIGAGLLFILGLLINILNEKPKVEQLEKYEYRVIKNIMTDSEIKLYTKLKDITDKYNLDIVPQVQLIKVFSPIDNDIVAFNKIKAKSIDFAVIDKQYNYKFFIELDDYTHNRNSRKKRDNFVNALFNKYGLKLYRINSCNYTTEQLEEIIKEQLIADSLL